MRHHHSRSLATSIVLLLPVLLAFHGTAGATHTGYGFHATWDDGLDGWEVQGAGADVDCGTAVNGCALRVAPACCGAYVDVQTRGEWAVETPIFLDWWFRVDDIGWNADFEVEVHYPGDDFTVVGFTGGGGNDGMSAVTRINGVHSQTEVFHRVTPGVWYHVGVHFDPVDDAAKVLVRDASGSILARSSAFPVPPDTVIEMVRVQGIDWSSDHGELRVDDMRLQRAHVPLPRNLVASAGPTPDAVTLRWDAPAHPGVTYVVSRALSPDGPFETVAAVTETTTWRDEGVPDADARYYHVTARVGEDASAPSAVVCGTTLPSTWLACGTHDGGDARTLVSLALEPVAPAPHFPADGVDLVRVTGAPSEEYPGAYHVRVAPRDSGAYGLHVFTAGLVTARVDVGLQDVVDAYDTARNVMVLVRVTQTAVPEWRACAVATGSECAAHLPVDPMHPYPFVWHGDRAGVSLTVLVFDEATGTRLAEERVLVPHAGQAGTLLPPA